MKKGERRKKKRRKEKGNQLYWHSLLFCNKKENTQRRPAVNQERKQQQQQASNTHVIDLCLSFCVLKKYTHARTQQHTTHKRDDNRKQVRRPRKEQHARTQHQTHVKHKQQKNRTTRRCYHCITLPPHTIIITSITNNIITYCTTIFYSVHSSVKFLSCFERAKHSLNFNC